MNGCDARFPPHLWCYLIPQVEQTLNFLRHSRINPKLSSYKQIYGLFDFNSTPLAPLGIKVNVYEPKPQHIFTWSDCGQHCWYICPATTHYRNNNVYINTTQATRHSGTVVFLTSKLSMPATSTTDHLIIILTDLLHELKNPHLATSFTDFGTPTNNAIPTKKITPSPLRLLLLQLHWGPL